MLNLLVNTESLRDYPRTGIPFYTWHLFTRMLSHHEITTLYAFTGKRFVKYQPSQLGDKLPRLELIKRFMDKASLLKFFLKYSEQAFEKFSKKNPQKFIYHEPNFITKNYEGPCVPTLHDITCIRYPHFQPVERVKWFEEGLVTTLRQANHIISVSEFTRQEAIRYLQIKPEQITTVYNGVSPDYHQRTVQACQDILLKYKLDYQRYVLSVCTLEPRKNLSSLIKGYMKLPSNTRKQFPLILVGSLGWKVSSLIQDIKNNYRNDVKILGYVPKEDLPYIFSGAKAFSYLSTYEGFGLPVLEALASGVPVLTSSDSAMAEFSKEQALLVDPLDIDAIAEGFTTLLANDVLSLKAQSLAKHYQQKFTWERCLQDTLAIFKKISL